MVLSEEYLSITQAKTYLGTFAQNVKYISFGHLRVAAFVEDFYRFMANVVLGCNSTKVGDEQFFSLMVEGNHPSFR